MPIPTQQKLGEMSACLLNSPNWRVFLFLRSWLERGYQMIKVQGLTKIYVGKEEIKAIQGVDLSIKKGEVFGIIGLSGAGKSSLLRCLNLLEVPSAGEVTIDGLKLTSLADGELRKARQKVGMIFQQFNLLSSRTVAENVEFPLEIIGEARSKRKRRVRELLQMVGLENRDTHYPSQLSGGEKQRVGIARALASRPKVLLCDEATSALDPATTKNILALLQEINKRLGLTIVLITHQMEVIRMICDRVAVLDQGQIVEMGTVQEIFLHPKAQITRQLMGDIQLSLDQKLLKEVGDGWILKLTFMGSAAKEPIISQLVKKYQFKVNILAGNIAQVGGEAYGELIIQITGLPIMIKRALAELNDKQLKVEVISRGNDTAKSQ